MTSQFKPGDRVRCIDASLSWRPTCEFEPWDKPESVTDAPDAAAELEKIAKLLDELDVPFSHSDTYGRVRCLAAELARHKRDEWQNKHERLSGAIK